MVASPWRTGRSEALLGLLQGLLSPSERVCLAVVAVMGSYMHVRLPSFSTNPAALHQGSRIILHFLTTSKIVRVNISS